MRHEPVLLNEVIASLQLKPGDVVVDCTLGDGGHSEAMLEQIIPNGKLLGIDADAESVLRAKRFLYRFGDAATFVRGNFSELSDIADTAHIAAANAIIMDLGWSSPQFAERGRGFSFLNNEPLDMRYHFESNNNSTEIAQRTAATVVNETTVTELARIFKKYGEENFAMDIAKAIADQRRLKPITQTGELVEIILQVYRTKLKSIKEVPWIGGLHPATKVFQALRIEVNNELGVLEQVLPQAFALLALGGHLAVITFHSLEDRIVKQFMQTKVYQHSARLAHKKPVTASAMELEINPRAGSAKLRVLEKIA